MPREVRSRSVRCNFPPLASSTPDGHHRQLIIIISSSAPESLLALLLRLPLLLAPPSLLESRLVKRRPRRTGTRPRNPQRIRLTRTVPRLLPILLLLPLVQERSNTQVRHPQRQHRQSNHGQGEQDGNDRVVRRRKRSRNGRLRGGIFEGRHADRSLSFPRACGLHERNDTLPGAPSRKTRLAGQMSVSSTPRRAHGARHDLSAHQYVDTDLRYGNHATDGIKSARIDRREEVSSSLTGDWASQSHAPLRPPPPTRLRTPCRSASTFRIHTLDNSHPESRTLCIVTYLCRHL